VATDGADLLVEVADDVGHLVPEPDLYEPPDVESESGRGLFLARALTDDLSVTVDPGRRTVVRCTRRDVLAPPGS
jgi:anti-sigma regulatory factor (Ser/Thr protein kinase)